MLWRAEPIFAGRAVACVAGGPSLSLAQVRAIGIARARDDIRVVAVNDAVYPCFFADLLYACDREWLEAHDGVPGFDGRRVTLSHGREEPYPDADWLNATGPEGFEPDPSGLRTAGMSGYQALNLCAHLGAGKVLLVGYDCKGGTADHWFGKHPDECRREIMRPFEKRAHHFDGIAGPLRERGIDVVNCSPGSAITAFRTGDLMTELKSVEKPKPKPIDKQAVYIHRQMLAGTAGYKTR
jgi:hypothetical protein